MPVRSITGQVERTYISNKTNDQIARRAIEHWTCLRPIETKGTFSPAIHPPLHRGAYLDLEYHGTSLDDLRRATLPYFLGVWESTDCNIEEYIIHIAKH
ncbi:hypothetical protein RRG08_002917 [Elysia crispata]|uniref:Uncharacterized protein n=1 Tax=Elysia crispata TaxID=231223 RepID=A0AAE1AQN8_9GAST|nr:hypothetical protein RRG08_002917 [Elysia crispata]